MKWGIMMEWTMRGLTCCEWVQRTDEPTTDDPVEFDSEADAAHFISRVEREDGVILLPHQLADPEPA